MRTSGLISPMTAVFWYWISHFCLSWDKIGWPAREPQESTCVCLTAQVLHHSQYTHHVCECETHVSMCYVYVTCMCVCNHTREGQMSIFTCQPSSSYTVWGKVSSLPCKPDWRACEFLGYPVSIYHFPQVCWHCRELSYDCAQLFSGSGDLNWGRQTCAISIFTHEPSLSSMTLYF